MIHSSQLPYPSFPNLLSELENLINDNIISWHNNQICLNTPPTEPNNFKLGVGSLTKDWDNKTITEDITKEVHVPFKTSQFKEEEFTQLCDCFRKTEFQKIYDFILSKYKKVGRIRLMKLDPRSCLSWHKDDSMRLHYVLSTDIGAYIIVENELNYLKKDNWYIVNTKKYHTAMNSSLKSRIHLVACIL